MPANAANKNVSWDSNKPEIATVENGLITAQAIGRASIKVTTEDGARTAICVVTVFESVEIEMIRVEGGTFLMGCSDDECNDNELPQHQVTLSSFQISKYPITQKQWISIMGNNPSFFRGDDLPVETVNWHNVQDFIFALNKATGKNYRLPTEAEWEFAARGGNKSEGYKYSGSNNIDEVAWYYNNSNNKTHPVGTKKPNELGIYDMSGHVLEWCNDWYEDYNALFQNNPQGPHSGNWKVLRGGDGCTPFVSACRVSWRPYMRPEYSGGDRPIPFGFRLVLPE
jgi:formylglycine-generating enzyme required for sulfatase activity